MLCSAWKCPQGRAAALQCSIPSEAQSVDLGFSWEDGGKSKVRTLKADDKDLNLASATLTVEPQFPSVERGQ